MTRIVAKGNRSKRGFTIIELLFVVIVIAVLAAAGIAMYLRSLDNARASEGLAILSSVRTHFLVEWAENDQTPPVGGTPAVDNILGTTWGIDTTKNRWWIEGTGFDTDWTWYTTLGKQKVALIGKGTPLSGKALSIECETGEIVQNYDYSTGEP